MPGRRRLEKHRLVWKDARERGGQVGSGLGLPRGPGWMIRHRKDDSHVTRLRIRHRRAGTAWRRGDSGRTDASPGAGLGWRRGFRHRPWSGILQDHLGGLGTSERELCRSRRCNFFGHLHAHARPSLGAAVCGTVLNLGIQHYAPHAGDAVNRLLDLARRAVMPAGERIRLVHAVANSLLDVYLVAAAMVVAALFLGLCLPARLSPRNHKPVE